MTLKRWVFLGLVILSTGSTLLGWLLWQGWANLDQVRAWPNGIFSTSDPNRHRQWAQMPYNNPEKFDQILEELQAQSEQDRAQEQAKRLRADLVVLAQSPPDDPQLAQALYGPGWQAEVKHFHKQQTQRKCLLTASLTLIGCGGFLSLVCLLLRLTRFFIRHGSAVFQRPPNPEEPDVSDVDAPVRTTPSEIPPAAPESSRCRPKLGALTDPVQSPAKPSIELPGLRLQRNRDDEDSPTYKRHHPVLNEYCLNDLTGVDVRLRNLFADEPLAHPGTRDLKQDADPVDCPPAQEAHALAADTRTPGAESTAGLAQSLQSKTARVEQQLHDFQEMAQGAQGSAEAQSMNMALQEMSAQISAIRNYAASQQDRVEKLQTGYDWNIIRQFGLRIIRCVDNLEQRIDKQENPETLPLTEIRDELLFALESSGIEQFMPELHSPYRGQERSAEAVKEKEPCNDPEWVGKIAHIVKPGYQYVIDEDNTKVVRTARVKLYG